MSQLIKKAKKSYYIRKMNKCYAKAMEGSTDFSTMYWIEKRNDYLNKMLAL